MAAGVIGVHSLNVLSHVAEVYRHDIGNVTVQVLNMEEIIVRGTKMRHGLVILKYAQVNKNSSFVTFWTDIQNIVFSLEHKVACIQHIKYFRLRFGITKYVSVTMTNYT